MKREALLTLGAVVALLATGCQPGPQAQPRTQTSSPKAAADQPEAAATSDDPQQIALAAKDELFKQLSTRLIEAMSNGGPAAAIEVCSREAPEIAAVVGKEHGVWIGRTSFKTPQSKERSARVVKTVGREAERATGVRQSSRRRHGRVAANQAKIAVPRLSRANRADCRRRHGKAHGTLSR